MLNGDAHHSSEVEAELRISRCRIFKQTMCIISDCAPPFHQLTPLHRILYVGLDLELLAALKHTIKHCQVIRSPGADARILIQSNIPYSLFLLDAQLPYVSVQDLTHLIHSLPHRERTPLIIHKDSDDPDTLIEAITRSLPQASGG